MRDAGFDLFGIYYVLKKVGVMSFKTGHVDLSDTIFSADDLAKARVYLSSLITKVDSSWTKKPKGPLGEYWNSDSPYAACFLIDTAFVLNLFERRISPRSAPIFLPKVEGILEPNSQKEFIENLTEFQVGFVLAQYVSPLDVDPLVPDEFLLPLTHHQRPKTPDFAVQLPDSKVFFEVTVLHVQILDDWDKGVDDITIALKDHLRKQQKDLTVHIQFPLPFPRITNQMIKHLLRRIDASASGREIFSSGGEIRWELLPAINAPDISSVFSAFFNTSSPIAVFSTSGRNEGLGRAFAQQRNVATMPEADRTEANRRLFNSLCNTLDRKKEQLAHAKPALLVLKLGHHWLLEDELITKIQERIWPNPQYDWMTGIVLFTPRQGFSRSDAEHRITLWPNPKARCPASNSLISLFSGKSQFHFR